MARGLGKKRGEISGAAAGRARNKGLTVTFDEDARREFVTGFRRRKEQRRKEARRLQEAKARRKRLEERAERRLHVREARGLGPQGAAEPTLAGCSGSEQEGDNDRPSSGKEAEPAEGIPPGSGLSSAETVPAESVQFFLHNGLKTAVTVSAEFGGSPKEAWSTLPDQPQPRKLAPEMQRQERQRRGQQRHDGKAKGRLQSKSRHKLVSKKASKRRPK